MTEVDEILLERYIEGSLTAEELTVFEDRLNHESDLKEAYNNSMAAYEFIKEAGRMELKETLNSFENQNKGGKRRLYQKKRTYLIAASILFFLGFYFMSDSIGIKSSAQVYESYFDTYPAPSTLRGNETQATPYWDAAVAHYANENYQDALANFERAESTILKDKVEFYKSLCHLQLDDKYLNTTLHSLRKISNGDSNYREQALWYYALGSLKNGNEQEAMYTFERIVKNKSYGYEEASEILKTKIED